MPIAASNTAMKRPSPMLRNNRAVPTLSRGISSTLGTVEYGHTVSPNRIFFKSSATGNSGRSDVPRTTAEQAPYVLIQILHQPEALMAPSTDLQALGASNSLQPAQS